MLPPQFPHRNAGLRFIAAFLALSFTLPSPAFALRPSGADDERGSVRAGLEDQLLGSPKKWLGTLLVSLLGFLPVPDLAGAPPVNQRPAEMPFNASHPDLGPYFSDPDGSRWLKWGRSFAYVHGPDLLKGFNVKKVVSNPQQPVQKLIEMVQPLSPEMKRFSNLEAIQGLQRSKLELSPKNVNADLQLQKRLRRMVEKEIIGPRSFVLVTHGHFVAGIAGLAGFTSKGGEQYLFDTAIYFPRGEWPVRSASAQNAADLQLQLWAESIQRARQEHQDKKRKAAGGIAVGLFGHRDELEPTELAFGTAYIDPEKLFGKPKDFRRFFRDRGFQNLVIVTEEPTLNPDRINLLPLKRLEDGVFGNKDLYGYMRRLQELGIPVEVVNGDMRPPGGVFGRKLAEEDKSRPHPKETPPSPKQAGAEETTRFRSGTVNADVFRDIGGRSKQEDASGSVETLDPQGRVLVKSFLVLDGMGGLGAGHIASGEALETLRDYLRGEPFGRVIARYSAASSLAEEEKWERQLRAKAIKYIQGAEERLIAVAASKKLSRMGTTLTLALLLESKFRGLHAYLFSVGDSPAYHYHAATGRVDLLTVEDTIDSFYIRRELIEESQSPAVSWKDWFFSFMGIRKPPPKPITPESFWDPKTLSGDPAALRLLVQRLRDPDPEKPHNPGLTSYLGAEGARSDGGFKTPLNDSSIKPVRVLLKPGDGLLLATDGISKGLSQQAPKEGDEIRFLEGIFEEQKDQPVSVLVRRVGELSAGKPHGDNRTAYAIFLTAPTPAAGAEETVQERVNKLLLPIAMFPDDARQKALMEIRQIGPEAHDFLIEALKERPTLERANWILPTGAAIALRTIATNLSPDERLRAISSLQEILSIQTLRELRKMDPKMELHPHTWLSWVLPAAIRALQAIDRKAAADALYRLERDTVKEHGSLAAVVDKALENASAAGAEETVNRLMAEVFGTRGELPIRWVGTNSSGESSFLEDSYRLELKWRVWGSARDGSLEVSVDLDFRPLGKERKLSRSAREAMEKYSFRVIGPVGSPQVPFQKLVAESPDYEYGDEGGRYMDGRLKLELTPEEASKLKSAGTFFLIQVSPPSPVAINPADLSAASETTPAGSVNITEQPLHWVALQQFLAHFQPGQQVWTKELARMFPSTPEENLARFLEEIGWRKGARKDDVNPGQGLRFFKVSGVQVAVSPQEVVFFLSQTHAIFLAPFGWIMGPLQQLIGQKRVLEITVNGAPLSMEYQPDGVVIELGRALKEAGIAGQLQLRFEREGARLKVSSPAAGPIPPTPAAGAEESVVASALNSPDIRRRLKESGFAPVEGGFLARPLLFENEGRLFLQAGLEEPRGMPKQVPIFWADEATVAGMLGYVKKMGVSSQDGFLFNGKSFTLTQAMAVLPLPMPASAILDPRVQPTASEVAVILHLSRRTGTLYVVRITRLTFGESQEPLLFIQIQA